MFICHVPCHSCSQHCSYCDVDNVLCVVGNRYKYWEHILYLRITYCPFCSTMSLNKIKWKILRYTIPVTRCLNIFGQAVELADFLVRCIFVKQSVV